MPDMPEVRSSLPTRLSKDLQDELASVLRGQLHLPQSPRFLESTALYNGSLQSKAQAVISPVDAEDISRVIQFCRKHSLFPSVKAGGYGIAGWAIAGDIVLDLSNLSDISIEPPRSDGSFTSLRDIVPSNSKGKGRQMEAPTISHSHHEESSGKRKREDDEYAIDDMALVETRASASRAVASFLHGPRLPPRAGGIDGMSSPPSNRRRIGEGIFPAAMASSNSKASSTGSGSSSGSSSRDSNTNSAMSLSSTAATSPQPYNGQDNMLVDGLSKSPLDEFPPTTTSGRDPFAYLDEDESHPMPEVQPVFNPHASRFLNTSYNTSMPPEFVVNSSALANSQFLHPIPLNPRAFVTFGSGARQKDVDRFVAAEKNMLEARFMDGRRGAVPYHVPFAAHPVGSSVMILGGYGFLSRLHGLSTDNLVEAEVVLADGRIVICSERENEDLWWAIRGAGPALGIVTRYKAIAYPIPVVYAGNRIYRFHPATAPSLIKHVRDCIKGAPRELYMNVLLTTGPAGQDSLVVIQMCFIGTREQGQAFNEAIIAWDIEECLLSEVDEKRFVDQQESVAQVLRGKAGREWIIRSTLIKSLPDDIIHETVSKFSHSPPGTTWLFELAGGAVVDTKSNCIPHENRDVAFNVAAFLQAEDHCREDNIAATEEWIHGTLSSVSVGGPYPSFLGKSEPSHRVMGSYGENWGRLCDMKKKYDPTGFFKHSFWPLDANGELLPVAGYEPISS